MAPYEIGACALSVHYLKVNFMTNYVMIKVLTIQINDNNNIFSNVVNINKDYCSMNNRSDGKNLGNIHY